MMVRNEVHPFLHLSNRLFQEFILSGWLLTETQRLHFQSSNQGSLRADKYCNVQAAIANRGQENNNPIGKKILASSFTGGPRWYHGKYEDAMALVREFHKPDYFITMTCNPKWQEITSVLSAEQKPQDRPDVVSRVFYLKMQQLLNDLTVGEALGKVIAYLAVVEWQKRGLPHTHILLIVSDQDQPKSSEDVDRVISAEFPPPPETVDSTEWSPL